MSALVSAEESSEESQVLTDPGDKDSTAILSVARRIEQPGSNPGVVSEDEDEKLLPGDCTDNARP